MESDWIKIVLRVHSVYLSSPQDFFMQDTEIREMLADLVWLNALIATELIQVTENTSSILRKSPPPEGCMREHAALRATVLQMAEKYRPGTMLVQHLTGHQ